MLEGALADLPPPPAGRSGWPWTAVPVTPAPGERPTIGVVTPSYQQADFLEQTLRSVLLQDYPDVDYWVFDGGSTDGSVAVLERYARWLGGWRSAPDRGQSDAVCKGFQRARGDWLCWLNSDDILHPEALHAVAPILATTDRAWVVGRPAQLQPDGSVSQPSAPAQLRRDDLLYDRVRLSQPAVLLSRAAIEACGGPRIDLDFAMDYDLWLRLYDAVGPPACVDLLIGLDRIQPRAKTVRGWYRYDLEMATVAAHHAAGQPAAARRAVHRHWRRRSAAARAASAADHAAHGRRGAAIGDLARALVAAPLATLQRRSLRSAVKGIVFGGGQVA